MNMKKLTFPLIILLSLLLNSNSLFLINKAVTIDSSVIIVPDDYPSIQLAINEAKEYSTIIVKEGEYAEKIVINKPLKILGVGNKSVIIGEDDSHIVEISRVSNVIFANFQIKGTRKKGWAGIYVSQSSNVSIFNVSITNCFRGIYIWDSVRCTLRNVTMTGNDYSFEVWGLPLQHFVHDIDMSNRIDGRPICYIINKRNLEVPADAAYVAIVNSTSIIAKNLHITNNGQGLLMAYSTNCSVKDSTFARNVLGVHVILSRNITVSKNDIIQNENYGLLMVASSMNNISHNIFKKNYAGITLSYSSLISEHSNENLLTYNLIKENNYGIVFLSANNNIVVNNIIEDNVYGITIQRSCENLIFNNNFLENTYQVTSDLSENMWDSGYFCGGNYWSNYDGDDVFHGPYQNITGSDGIIDHPYIINENNIDRYPLLRPLDICISIITVSVRFEPKILNLRSGSRVLTAYIALPEEFSIKEVIIPSITLNDTVTAEPNSIDVKGYNGDPVSNLIVNFDMRKVAAKIFSSMDLEKLREEEFVVFVKLALKGKLCNGIYFYGIAPIKVVMPDPGGLYNIAML